MQIQRQFQSGMNNVAAIPDDAIANAISFFDRIDARISFIINVLPVPPGALKKNFSNVVIDTMHIVSLMSFYSDVNSEMLFCTYDNRSFVQ